MAARPEIRHVLLYRTPEGWRLSIQHEDGSLLCGGLRETPSSAEFGDAAREFEGLLRGAGVSAPLAWELTQPDWWSADVPGAPA